MNVTGDAGDASDTGSDGKRTGLVGLKLRRPHYLAKLRNECEMKFSEAILALLFDGIGWANTTLLQSRPLKCYL